MPNRIRTAQALRDDYDRHAAAGRAAPRERGARIDRVRAIYVYPPHAEVLDFAGSLQALFECNELTNHRYEILHCGLTDSVMTAQGVQVAGLAPLPEPRASDVVFAPGFPLRTSPPATLPRWLRACDRAGARIFAICTGAFLLGRAGLLDGRRCTTHWRRTAELQTQFPKANVLTGRLFVQDGRVTTSAGVASGIDMTLDFIEQEHGPLVASRVAREIVVYIRRDATHKQESMYVEHRTHINPGVHAVQDWLIAHPDTKCGLAELAKIANMSERNLTRAFLRATGVSVGEYRQTFAPGTRANIAFEPRAEYRRNRGAHGICGCSATAAAVAGGLRHVASRSSGLHKAVTCRQRMRAILQRHG